MNSYYKNLICCVKNSKNISEVLIEPGALEKLPKLLKKNFSLKSVVILADQNTWVAAGIKLKKHLDQHCFQITSHVLDGNPEPTVELAGIIIDEIRNQKFILLAVGSGVINDLARYIAFKLNVDFVSVPTAASMDGYASAGSPLSLKGFKKTIKCKSARLIIADLDVLSMAPESMLAWGFSDIAGKIPAGADWIISDFLKIEPINQNVWGLVHDGLREWLSKSEELKSENLDPLTELISRLTMIGLAMEAHGSSRPASGAEHQIAHIWEMEDLKYNQKKVSHGSCVAIGSLISLLLYEWLYKQDLLSINIEELSNNSLTMKNKINLIVECFGQSELSKSAISETEKKHLECEKLKARLKRIIDEWPQIKNSLESNLITSDQMTIFLKNAGAVYKPKQIGITKTRMYETLKKAIWIRERYTILDLLFELGYFEKAIKETISRLEFK